MEGIYHDPENPQLDAVERYRLFPKRELEKKDEVYELYFLKSQLMADVLFQLRIITRGRRKEDNQDNGLELTDDLKYQFERWIDTYVSRSKKPLARYLVEDKVHGVPNVVSDSDEVTIKFKVGDWWNSNVLSLLLSKVHDYIVTGLMYEYLLLYFGSGDSIVQSKEKSLVLLMEEIKNLMLSYKAGSVQKQFHPFPFFRQIARISFICFWICKINGLMGNVVISAQNNIKALLNQFVTIRQHFTAKIKFIR